jgi:hypothetical protein
VVTSPRRAVTARPLLPHAGHEARQHRHAAGEDRLPVVAVLAGLALVLVVGDRADPAQLVGVVTDEDGRGGTVPAPAWLEHARAIPTIPRIALVAELSAGSLRPYTNGANTTSRPSGSR